MAAAWYIWTHTKTLPQTTKNTAFAIRTLKLLIYTRLYTYIWCMYNGLKIKLFNIPIYWIRIKPPQSSLPTPKSLSSFWSIQKTAPEFSTEMILNDPYPIMSYTYIYTRVCSQIKRCVTYIYCGGANDTRKLFRVNKILFLLARCQCIFVRFSLYAPLLLTRHLSHTHTRRT